MITTPPIRLIHSRCREHVSQRGRPGAKRQEDEREAEDEQQAVDERGAPRLSQVVEADAGDERDVARNQRQHAR
jgi:hypothetical protein